MSQRKYKRGETRVGSHDPPKPHFHPGPCWDLRTWRDPEAPEQSWSKFPSSSYNMIPYNHWPTRLPWKRNPGIWYNHAFLTIIILNAGNSFCYHCFSNMHLKCIVNVGWCYCLSRIFLVPWVQHTGVLSSFNSFTLFFFQMQLKQ